MKVNILREILWFGGNFFHLVYYDESVFRINAVQRFTFRPIEIGF